MEKKKTFSVPEKFSWNNFAAKIREKFHVSRQEPEDSVRTYYETYDWRLYKANLCLFRTDNEYQLNDLDDTGTPLVLNWKLKKTPKFSWEFNNNELKELLDKKLGPRALIPLIETHSTVEGINVLNDDHKTVLRVYFRKTAVRYRSRSADLPDQIMLEPIRGYQQEFEGFEKFVIESGIIPDLEQKNFLLSALEAIRREPSEYSSKVSLQLAPDTTCREAAAAIFEELLNLVKTNEPGIKEDIDSEFLHDFRTSIRRTRSGLAQIKGIFPKDFLEKFKRDFAYIGKMSNKLRDLDVYLLKQNKYRKMLPELLQPGLEQFFLSLQRQRKREHKKLLKNLESPAYRDILHSWDKFLKEQHKLPETANSHVPAVEAAKKFIFKRFQKIICTGTQIAPETPDDELHQLRINCKKLRYNIEFFASLFPAKEIADIVSHLKKLQDNLGDFNDLSVQIQALCTKIHRIHPDAPGAIDIAAAIGGLVTRLSREKQLLRNNFQTAFDQFNSKNTIQLFNKLFGESK